MRDKIINLHSSVANSKDILKKALINNTSNPDQNILQGEIAVINTTGNEGIYTLNSDGTDIIEFKPLSKEEKEQITALISAGVKDEVYVGNNEPSGEQELWIDLDADPSITTSLVVEAPTDGKIYGRNGQDKTWVDVSNALTAASSDEIYIGTEAPTGDEVVWIDTDENPTYSDIAVTEAPKDGKQYARQDGAWSEVSGGSTQYLDLSMFTGDTGTLSEEDYQKVVKAYEDGVSKVYVGETLVQTFPNIMPLSIAKLDNGYILSINIDVNYKDEGLLIYGFSIEINDTDKSFNTYQISRLNYPLTLYLNGSGTKALTDNGEYAEFASPTKMEDGGTGAITKELKPNTFYKFGECSSLTITLAAEKPGILNEYMFEFSCSPSIATTFNNIPGVVWQNGEPLVPEAGYKYQVSIVNNMGVYGKFPLSVGILTYTTTGASESVQLINKQEYAKKITLEDGTDVPITGTGSLDYTFPEAGEHKVWIEFKEDVTDFSQCFNSCSGLTSIPENLFASNTAVTTFQRCFRNCTSLTSIPDNLFANNIAVTDFSNCFSGCTSLTSIPDNLFASNTAVTDFHSCFYGCTGLTGSIPDNLFSSNTAVTDFNTCFAYCSGLTSIPANLFSTNTAVTNFNYCFASCKGLTGSIPENLFANNTAVTDFSNCFYHCSGLTSIPENLFASNTAVIDFNNCFYRCSGLTSIPENLFASNTAVTDFNTCFSYCSGLTSILL